MARSRIALAVFGTLLVIDGVFLVGHVGHIYAGRFAPDSFLADPTFSVEREGGYSERYEYAKTLFCVGALTACFARTWEPIHGALSLVFALILMDNALGLHERLGGVVARGFDWAEGMFASAPRVFGEFGVLVAAAAGAAALLLAALARSGREHRAFGGLCLALIALLAGFGVGVDLLHAMVDRWNLLNRGFGLLEDGGELVVLSACCAVSAVLFARIVPAAVGAAPSWDGAPGGRAAGGRAVARRLESRVP